MSYVVLKTRKTQPAGRIKPSLQATARSIQYNTIDTLVSQSSVNTAACVVVCKIFPVVCKIEPIALSRRKSYSGFSTRFN
jgi:hypothetical protein